MVAEERRLLDPQVAFPEVGVEEEAEVVGAAHPRYLQYPTPSMEAVVEVEAAADHPTSRFHVHPLQVASVVFVLESCQG